MATAEADVEARLGRSLTAAEVVQVPGLLEEASALVAGYLGDAYPDPLTDVVKVVESRIVARALTTSVAAGVASRQESAGPVSLQTVMTADAASSGGIWLSKADRLMLAGLRPSMVSVRLGSERS